MTTAQHHNYAKAYLRKAREYFASAQDNLVMERLTPTGGDAIHAAISAKDAIVMALTGVTAKGRDHRTAAKELRLALGQRPQAAKAESALREALAAKASVEYGTELISVRKAQLLLRRAKMLVELAREIVQLGG